MENKCKVCGKLLYNYYGDLADVYDRPSINNVCSDCSFIHIPNLNSYADDITQDQINELDRSIKEIIAYINEKELKEIDNGSKKD